MNIVPRKALDNHRPVNIHGKEYFGNHVKLYILLHIILKEIILSRVAKEFFTLSLNTFSSGKEEERCSIQA